MKQRGCQRNICQVGWCRQKLLHIQSCKQFETPSSTCWLHRCGVIDTFDGIKTAKSFQLEHTRGTKTGWGTSGTRCWNKKQPNVFPNVDPKVASVVLLKSPSIWAKFIRKCWCKNLSKIAQCGHFGGTFWVETQLMIKQR